MFKHDLSRSIVEPNTCFTSKYISRSPDFLRKQPSNA